MLKIKKTFLILTTLIAIGVIIAFFVFDGKNILTTENLPYLKNNELIEVPSDGIFSILANPDDWILVDGKTIPIKVTFGLKSEFEDVYKQIGVYELENKPLIIVPIFTASAYEKNGFYNFFKNNCNQNCLTTEIISKDKLDYHSSANAVKVLELLGYDSISDIELDKNSDILLSYNSVIILHNEYVTKKMFDAITSHPNVVFLYPNSLYAEISVNYEDNTISLIKGHGYPESSIINGFDWEFENTHPYEFDTKCNDWDFYTITNGVMLNCYPEQKIWNDELLLKKLKEITS
jgi:hypothetical protein